MPGGPWAPRLPAEPVGALGALGALGESPVPLVCEPFTAGELKCGPPGENTTCA